MKSYIALTACLLLLLSLSCGTARRGAPVSAPLNIESPAVAKGEAIFMSHCQKCHPGGATGLGPAINNKPLPGFLIRFQIRHGLGMMPAFKKEHLPKEDLDNLMVYLKELRSAK